MDDPVIDRESVDDRWGTPQRGLPPTDRQLEVLLMVVLEHGNAQAARKLGISVQTVKNHLSHLYARGPYHDITHATYALWPLLKLRENSPDRRSGLDRRGGTRRH